MAVKSKSKGKKSKRPRSRAQRWLFRYGWLLPLGALVVSIGLLLLTYAFASIPLPEDVELPSSAEVYDAQGRLIGTYTGDVRRFIIDTSKIPDYVGEAVIASEDRDFYEHNGVSMRGIFRAGWANLTGGQIQQGGSTITQQYIKNAVLKDASRTFTRKFKEVILAIKMERRYSKAEILDFYLNTIYLGRGAYGIEAAARTYFNKSAEDLTLSEAAYFAGIIPAPESYQPDENKLGASERRDRVLDMMIDQNYITPAQAARAERRKVRLAPGATERAENQQAAYFMEWLRKEYLYPEYGNDLYTRGLKIYTTLNLDLQTAAEEAVDSVLTLPEDPQASLVSITPTGAVRAFVGGRDYTSVKKAKGFNFASDPPGRHAGSAFKPFTLLEAIEQGISPQSRFSGRSPMTIDDPRCYENGEPWEVDNYGGSSYGTVTLDQATTNSVNTVYAQLVSEVGPDNVAEMVEDFGFEPLDGAEEIVANCSLALGTLNVSPVEMARAYAGFAGRGALPEVMPIRYILDGEGDCIKEYRPDPKIECEEEAEPDVDQVAEQNSVDVLTQTMTHVVTSGTARAADIGRPVAGKTGTSQNNRDAWFGGYVPQLATVVWLGYPRQPSGVVPEMRYCSDLDLCRPVHGSTVTGGQFAAPIWAAYMRVATAEMEVEQFAVPEDTPDEIINSAPPPPAQTASPTERAEPTPTETSVPTPTEVPTPTPSGVSPGPTILPSPTGGGGGEGPGDDP